MCSDLLLKFNLSKCSCVRVGPASKFNVIAMNLCQGMVDWMPTFKYLGVNFEAGKSLTVDINCTSCGGNAGQDGRAHELAKQFVGKQLIVST